MSTKPVSNASQKPSYIVFGGVKVDENMIASRKKRKDGTFIIDFKNGQKIEYKEQNLSRGATIEFSGSYRPEHKEEDQRQMLASGLFGATITGSSQKDNIVLVDNNEQNTVIVDNDKNEDKVWIISSGNRDNNVKLEEEDSVKMDYHPSEYNTKYVGPDTFKQKKFDVET